jgi:hypothetical protein
LSPAEMSGIGRNSLFNHEATSSLRVAVSSPRAESAPRLSYMEMRMKRQKMKMFVNKPVWACVPTPHGQDSLACHETMVMPWQVQCNPIEGSLACVFQDIKHKDMKWLTPE